MNNTSPQRQPDSSRTPKVWLLLIFIFFGTIYALISLVNHYCFRTYALDLGAYTNALYDYLRLRTNDSTVFKEIPENLLSDHFDLYLVLFSPFSILFKTYTLPVIQIASVILGGYGIYKYFQSRINDLNVHLQFSLWMSVAFFLFYGIYSALSYDYHSNVVASMFVPFLFLFLYQKKWIKAFIILFIICIGKENMALWMCFVLVGWMWEKRKEKESLIPLSALFIFSLAYFLIITKFVMPHLSNEGKFYQFKYSVLGHNYTSAIHYLLTHPVEALKLLFINHTNNSKADFVKAELHIFLLISGLWALFFKPHYLVMIIPVYFQKLYHDNYLIWSIDAQYSVEFAPILTIGAGEFFLSLKNKKNAVRFAVVLCILNLICTIRLMDRTIVFTNKSRIRFYQSSHYTRTFNIQNVYAAIQTIPETSIVSAQTSILPHLALRDKIYCFPIIKDAEYIVLNTKDDTYPLDTTAYKQQVNLIFSDTLHWKISFQKQSVIVFKRK
ncbi:MAG: hypothetical protein Fur0023_09220 [Bacteroidia bacterium]